MIKILQQKFRTFRVDYAGAHSGHSEDFKDYFTISEPSIMLSRGQLNPSVFATFNSHNQLINFGVSYTCDADKTEEMKTEVVAKLAATAFPCLDSIANKTAHEIRTQDYFIKWELDMASAYWHYQYRIGLNETR